MEAMTKSDGDLAHLASELNACRNCFEQILAELSRPSSQRTAYEAEGFIFSNYSGRIERQRLTEDLFNCL